MATQLSQLSDNEVLDAYEVVLVALAESRWESDTAIRESVSLSRQLPAIEEECKKRNLEL